MRRPGRAAGQGRAPRRAAEADAGVAHDVDQRGHMRRTLFKSKIHHAVLTGTELEYEGSIGLDADLMEAADLRPYEKVQVLNASNGVRLETYVIEAPRGSGEVCLNGPAARLGYPGDRVVIISYAEYDEDEVAGHRPVIVHVGEGNRPAGPRLRTESGS